MFLISCNFIFSLRNALVFVGIDKGTFCWAQISYFWRVNYRACDRLIFKRNNKLVSIPGYVLQSCQELCARDQVFLSRLISRSHKLNPANMALFVWNCRSRFSETSQNGNKDAIITNKRVSSHPHCIFRQVDTRQFTQFTILSAFVSVYSKVDLEHKTTKDFPTFKTLGDWKRSCVMLVSGASRY